MGSRAVPRLAIDEEVRARRGVAALVRDGTAVAHRGLEQPAGPGRGQPVEQRHRPAGALQGHGAEQGGAGQVGDAADNRMVAGHPAPQLAALRHAGRHQLVGQAAHAEFVAEVADADSGPRPAGEQAVERGVEPGDVLAAGIARPAVTRRAAALDGDDVADRAGVASQRSISARGVPPSPPSSRIETTSIGSPAAGSVAAAVAVTTRALTRSVARRQGMPTADEAGGDHRRPGRPIGLAVRRHAVGPDRSR